ncbi:hypothetical protein EVG20_g9793 [Dentipellis fragilis]|uniref:Uncharacterized protein n=1 Tax=Dentipellis fragilis TaxID=205917 RepID=A0A4Y9XVE3_9AGAM|nr:hypothetical protein EVG20_g9793 [Dentipellis fragilis]
MRGYTHHTTQLIFAVLAHSPSTNIHVIYSDTNTGDPDIEHRLRQNTENTGREMRRGASREKQESLKVVRYVLGLIIEACVQHQASTKLPDPPHVTAHYLNPTAIGLLEVHIRMLKSGQTLCNFTAELIQKGTTKVTTQSIFGNMDPAAAHPPEFAMTLEPASPLARVTPFRTPPSMCTPAKIWWGLNFKQHMLNAYDQTIAERHDWLSAAGIGEGGTEQGLWAGFIDPSDKLSASALAFFADVGPNKLALSMLPDEPQVWFPTIVMSLEVRAPLPREGGNLSTHTLGIMMASRFMNAPQSRHDIRVELWSAPGEIDDGKEVKEG